MLRDWLPEYVARYGPLSPELLRDVQALLACQTPAMGGRAEACACGFTDFYWASCHKRGCSTCPGVVQARWVAARLERMLPAQHLHCVLTLPQDLRPLVRENRRALYGLLMTSAATAVRERALAALGGDGAGARLAFTTVLHTWNARLLEHPHVHVVLAEGGFVPARDGQPARWVQPPPGECFLPPDRALAHAFRDRLLLGLEGLRRRGRLRFTGRAAPLAEDQRWDALLARLRDPRFYWHVYAKRELSEAQGFEYLGNYAARVGLSDARILSYDGVSVTLATKHGPILLTALELVRRALSHHLPRGFQRLRHHGLYHGKSRQHLTAAQGLLAAQSAAAADAALPRPGLTLAPQATFQEIARARWKWDPDRCPVCDRPGLVQTQLRSGATDQDVGRATALALRGASMLRARELAGLPPPET